MLIHADLASHHAENASVLGYHKRRSLHGEESEYFAPYAELLGDDALFVREQRKSKSMELAELPLLRDGVHADAHRSRTEFSELAFEIAEATALGGTTLCESAGVEEHHRRSAHQQVDKAHEIAVVVGKFEVLDQVTDVHHRNGNASISLPHRCRGPSPDARG